MNNSTYTFDETFQDLQELNYFLLLLFAIGVPGNILMFIVFSSKELTKLSVSVYFRAIAITNLFMNAHFIQIFFRNKYDFYLTNWCLFLCKSYNYIVYSAGAMTTWYLAVAGLDRLQSVAFPTRLQFIHRGRFPLIIVIAITVYNLLFYTEIFFFKKYVAEINKLDNSTYNVCFTQNEEILSISDFINSTVIPFLVMIFSTIGLSLVVYNSRKRMRKFQLSNNNTNNNKQDNRSLKFTTPMVIINIVFLIMNAPVYLNYYIVFDTGFNLGLLFLLMYYSYFSIEFYLQIAVNKLVRKEFLKIIENIFTKRN